jgi:hypothetical protein
LIFGLPLAGIGVANARSQLEFGQFEFAQVQRRRNVLAPMQDGRSLRHILRVNHER